MTPIEIVRAMLAEHANEDTSGMTSHERAAAHARRWTFEAVITALEAAESAPRLEWKRITNAHGLTIDIAVSFPYRAKVTVSATEGKRFVEARWTNPADEFLNYLIDDEFTGDADRGQRIAELVIARHRGMLAEIAGIK